MSNLLLAILPSMQTSKKSIHIPVESEIQAVLVVQAYGIDKLDSAELLEYHYGVIEGNPYQEHMNFGDFKAKLAFPRRTYVVMYTDQDGEDDEGAFEADNAVAAKQIADNMVIASKGLWKEISLGVYIDGADCEPITYTPPGQEMIKRHIDFHTIHVSEYPDTDTGVVISEPSGVPENIGRGMTTPLLFTAGSWPDDKEYIASAEEVASALEDADKMNFNMRTYGTIDVPAMAVYTLYYTDECHIDHEDEFEAFGDTHALFIAGTKCRGCEGLWTGISLTSSNENEIDFRPFG